MKNIIRKNTNGRKSISLGIVVNILSFTILKGFAIFTSPYITYVLDTAEYGNMSAYNIWRDVVCLVGGLGTVSSLVIFRSKNSSSEESYYKYCWNGVLIGALAHAIIFSVSMLLRGFLSVCIKLPAWLIPIIVISAFSQFVVSYLSNYLIIEGRAFYNMLLSLSVSVGGFAISVIILQNVTLTSGMAYLAFVYGYTIVSCFIGIVAILFFGIKGFGKINAQYTAFSIKVGIPLVIHLLAGTVFVSSDRIMIKNIIGDSESGLYSYAYNFANILYCVWSAINAIWNPFYMKYLNDGNVDGLMKKRRNYDCLFGCLYIGFLMMFIEVYKLIANERYWISMDIVPVIAISFVFNHLYSFPQGFESFKEKTVYTAIGTFGASIVNVILNIIFIPLYGFYGAAYATLLSYISFYIFHRFIASRILKKYIFDKYNDFYFLILGISFFMIYYLMKPFVIARWGIAFIAALVILLNSYRNRSII